MNLRWTLNRLRAMGPREVGHRCRQYLHARLERAGLGRVAPLPASDARGKPWVAELPRAFAVADYRRSAERILAGEFRLFDAEWMLGFPPVWNRDPATGALAPLVFGKTLDYRDERTVGNIKYLWEPNRHLELVTLAQAWRLSGEARFASACRMLVDSWIEQCPYLMGANWTSSLELALRLTNWSCAWHLLGGDAAPLFADAEGRTFKARWLNSVRQHCHFIAGHPSLYSSANNHLLGELLGLLLAAITWPCWPESAHWAARAHREFEQQALLQNGTDGVNKEQAIWYQHEVADMMLLAALTAQANGRSFGPMFWSRLESLLEFIASCMDAGGHVPAIGDADDAVIVRFCPARDFSVYRSLLATGSVLFGRADFKHKAQTLDDKSRWLLGDAAEARFAALGVDSSGASVRRSFAEGGYYVLGSDLESTHEVRIVADAAPLGYLTIAAHGHADALAFTLSVAGHPVLIDPGTYCYHTQRLWRDYFRGTSAHNTLRIDGTDQSVPGGAFLWTHRARVHSVSFESGATRARLVAEHDGYTRLADPVVHRREILYEHAPRLVTVTDHVVCKAAHQVEMFWHFAPDLQLTLEADRARVHRARMELTVRWPKSLTARVVRGSSQPPLGWDAPRFGTKVPADCLVVSGQIGPGWQGTSTLQIDIT
ncbi:MAG TPA: alginate lyase family protein [Steroidobacteraceae bacterium]|nr:alginate lyase family protein [Steroidobacteraceae bacterium]